MACETPQTPKLLHRIPPVAPMVIGGHEGPSGSTAAMLAECDETCLPIAVTIVVQKSSPRVSALAMSMENARRRPGTVVGCWL